MTHIFTDIVGVSHHLSPVGTRRDNPVAWCGTAKGQLSRGGGIVTCMRCAMVAYVWIPTFVDGMITV